MSVLFALTETSESRRRVYAVLSKWITLAEPDVDHLARTKGGSPCPNWHWITLAEPGVDHIGRAATPRLLASLTTELLASASYLGAVQLFPTLAEERTPNGVVTPRMGFSSIDQKFTLLVSGGRVDFTRNARGKEAWGPEDFGAFCREAGRVLSQMVIRLDLSGSRLAAIEEGMYMSLSGDVAARVGSAIMGRHAPLGHEVPFEWDWRYASKVLRNVGEGSEATNTIVTIRRQSGTFAPVGGVVENYDGIRLDIDINTAPENAAPRFGAAAIEAFFAESVGWHAGLSAHLHDLTGITR